MCLILLVWRPGEELVVAANRDELHDRATAGAELQPEGWLGGRDLVADGTWLGVTRAGRVAMVTNVREQPRREGERSRGELVRGFLEGEAGPLEYLGSIAGERYAGFNLLVGDRHELAYLSNRGGGPSLLTPGVHGVSNGALDEPWPKVELGTQALVTALGRGFHPDILLELLTDRTAPADDALPDTGVGIDLERVLGPLFIVTPAYGTRTSTALRVAADGVWFVERGYDPAGKIQATVRYTLELA